MIYLVTRYAPDWRSHRPIRSFNHRSEVKPWIKEEAKRLHREASDMRIESAAAGNEVGPMPDVTWFVNEFSVFTVPVGDENREAKKVEDSA